MPNDAQTRGKAAVAAFALFLATVGYCYLNSTVSGFWSIVYVSAAGLCMAAATVKLATGLGVSNALLNGSDRLFSIVTIIAPVLLGWNALLHVWEDGVTGAMACFNGCAVVPLVLFGWMDAWASIGGHKFVESVAHSADEAVTRAQNIANAAKGR